jgi:hypothetical protein
MLYLDVFNCGESKLQQVYAYVVARYSSYRHFDIWNYDKQLEDFQSSQVHIWCRENTEGDEAKICVLESDIYWGVFLCIYHFTITHYRSHFSL